MKKSGLKIGGAFSFALAALVSACGGGDLEGLDVEQGDVIQDDGSYAEEPEYSEELELGMSEQALQNCSNPDGTNAVMAAFAVAVGQELRRWQANLDFVVYNTGAGYENQPGQQQAIKLLSGTGPDGKPRGTSRCSDGRCARTHALLLMQYENARNQVWIQGESSTNKVLVDPGALRSRMVSKLREQATCDANARDGSSSNCPKEVHLLSAAGTASLGGCGPHYKFNVAKDPSGTLAYTGQLKWKLTFADQANGWVDFRQLSSTQVAIDPTYGLNEDGTTSSGSCMAACSKISTTDISGQCCLCSGLQKKWVKSTFSSSVFACK